MFVGGATIELWLTDPGAVDIRPTLDAMPARAEILGFENPGKQRLCRTPLSRTSRLAPRSGSRRRRTSWR